MSSELLAGTASVPELVARVRDSLEEVVPLVIGDRLVRAAGDGRTLDAIDPADGRPFARIVRGGPEEVAAAVAAAEEAHAHWRLASIEERSRLLHAIAARLREAAPEIAVLESLDSGKPLAQARTDVEVAARYFEFYGDTIEAFYGYTFRLTGSVTVSAFREPLGVTGHITPWNYPLAMAARVAAPAIAVGNCSVLKPSEEASLSSLRLGRLALEAGLPPGVLNVVSGTGPEAGAALASSDRIAHIGLIGSTETGRLVGRAAAENVVPVTLELGGKSPNIVFPDADLERAVPAIARGILQNAGQTCSAGSRLLVHESVRARLVEALAEHFASRRIGRGVDDPDLGPLISARQLDRVRSMVDRGRSEGRVVVGGEPLSGHGDGYFYPPTLIDSLDPGSYLAQTEVFGPVLAVTPFRDVEEAIAAANSTVYGLVAGVWTADVGTAQRVGRDIRAGQVFVNSFGAGGGVEIPFGGTGRSGYGREKGVEALLTYTHTKAVVVDAG